MLTTSNIIHCLIVELMHPLTMIVGSYNVLKDKIPETISFQMDEVGTISQQLAQEIIELRDHVDEKLNVHSPIEAATQIQDLASKWGTYETALADSIGQIRNSSITLNDPLLGEILTATLPHGSEKLGRILSYLRTIQPEQLTPTDDWSLLNI
jgi:hypothetical protein